jgi:hypothetical protein
MERAMLLPSRVTCAPRTALQYTLATSRVDPVCPGPSSCPEDASVDDPKAQRHHAFLREGGSCAFIKQPTAFFLPPGRECRDRVPSRGFRLQVEPAIPFPATSHHETPCSLDDIECCHVNGGANV